MNVCKRTLRVALLALLAAAAAHAEPSHASAIVLYQEANTTEQEAQSQESGRQQDPQGRPPRQQQQEDKNLTPEEQRRRQWQELRSRSPQAGQVPSNPEEIERRRMQEQVRRAQAAAKPAVKNDALQLQLEGSPIESLVSVVMEELGYSYVIDPAVTGTVTIHMQGGVPRDVLFEFLSQVLQMNGFGIVRRAPEFYAVVPLGQTTRIPQRMLVNPRPEGAGGEESQEGPPGEEPGEKEGGEGGEEQPAPAGSTPQPPPAGAVPASPGVTPQAPARQQAQQQQAAEQEPPAQEGEEPSASAPRVLGTSGPSAAIAGEQGVITYVIPLNFIPASEFLAMAQVYMSDGATVVDFAPANMLLITDYRANIQQVLNLVNLLDTHYFDINNIDLIPIRFHQAADVAEDLGKIFAPDDTAAGVRIVAIERLNSILAVTHGPDILEKVKEWITRLDSPSGSTNIRTYIYQVENNTADNIAAVLEQLYGDGFGLPSASSAAGRQEREEGRQERPQQRQQAGFTPQDTQRERQRGAFGERGQARQLGPSLSQRPTAEQGIRAAVSIGNVKIIVNDFNNSLIIQSTEADYKYLLDTIKQLDTLPRQVIIEADVYRVELTDNLSYGVQAFFEGIGGEEGPTGPFPATTGSIQGGTLNAATRFVIGDSRQLRLAINALRDETNVEMVDAPRLMTMDGIQATINIGAEVPVSTSSFSDPLQSGNTGFVNQIQFRPTGTTLLIIPRVSASGNVTLELSLEVSQSFTSGTEDRLTPTINRSFIETTLICRDGQTVAIGGIISESENNVRQRVPLLGDIPVFGALFGNTRREQNRSELIFMITPRVVQSLPTAAELTLDFQRALKNTYEYIQETEGRRRSLIEQRRQREALRNQDQ